MIDDEVFCKQHSMFQRVRKPGKATARPFGAGQSGLDEDSNKAILAVLSWDYMGAAEFERGECAKCLIYMHEHRTELIKSENRGFFFLTIAGVAAKAHLLWRKVVNQEFVLRHSPALDNPKVIGWFDNINGLFICRNTDMRDAVHTLLLVMDDQ